MHRICFYNRLPIRPLESLIFELDPPYANFPKAGKVKSKSKLSKALRKISDITDKFLFSLLDTSMISRIVESVWRMVLFLIAAVWFSTIIL